MTGICFQVFNAVQMHEGISFFFSGGGPPAFAALGLSGGAVALFTGGGGELPPPSIVANVGWWRRRLIVLGTASFLLCGLGCMLRMVSWVGRCAKQTRFVRPLAACLPLPPEQAAGRGPACLPAPGSLGAC